MTRRDIRDAILGAVLGGAAAGLSLWLASTTAQSAPYVVLVVLVITGIGLSLGAIPALIAYVVAGVILLLASLPPTGAAMAEPDILRLMVFAFGSPVVIVLGLRSEWQQRADRAAWRASRAAAEQANQAKLAADAARLEVRDALEQVDRERARLAEVAQAIPEPLIVYGPDGLGTFANNAALRTFGRSFYDRPLEDWARVVEPRDEGGSPLPREDWPQVRARTGPSRQRVLVRLPMSGRDLLVDVEGTPLPDGGSVLLLRDVGKEVDERRRLSRFAAFVAHELRNPLAVAKARMELANRGREAGRGVDHGARALESVDAAIGILERLELFSRAEAGKLDAGQDPFDLREAVDAGVERLQAQGSEREVRVIVHGDSVVHGDRGLTEQAITNLLTNADRYSQPNAPVEVEIDGREAPLLRVRDAGPGIPDDVAEVIFRERVGSGRGLGLGLFLVNAAMLAQGGTVHLEERRPRASFVLEWPRWAAAARERGRASDRRRVMGSEPRPTDLLRLRDAVDPYPAEPSDEQLAEELGLPPERVVRFDMNTLGGGPLPAVVEALRSFDPARLVEYGDQAYRRLRTAVEAATGSPAVRVIPGAGADELIRLVTTMTVGPGDSVVIPTPTFAMFAVEARLAGATVVEVARGDPGERQPVERIRAAAERAGARLVWLCSPNNPTGDGYAAGEIAALADGLSAVVVVDAVYQEMAEVSLGLPPEGASLLQLQDRFPNLLILRSLAKAYGLAGARVGYLVVPDGLAARFEASRLPLAIGGASEAAAIAALSDLAAARVRLAEIVAQRDRLAAAFGDRGWRVLPSLANFVLVRPSDAQATAETLLRQGLAVRSYPAGPLREWLRITVRAPAENDRLLEALGSIG